MIWRCLRPIIPDGGSVLWGFSRPPSGISGRRERALVSEGLRFREICYIFEENDNAMNTEARRVQTAIRLTPELLERVKRSAKREHRSVNSFIENILDKATEPVFPKFIGPDYQISDEIKAFRGSVSFKHPTQEQLDADPKLAYLVKKYGL